MENLRHYYDVVYKITMLTGAWPYLKPTARILRVGLVTLTIITIFIPQIAYQFTCKSNLQCTFESMTSYLLTIVALIKVYTIQLNNYKMKDLTQHLVVDWKTEKTPEQLKIMKLYANTSRQLCLIYVAYVLSGVIIFFSLPLVPFILDVMWPLNQSRPVISPYPGYYFVDTREYFFKIFWHSIISWEIIFTAVVAHDCLLMTYVEHICSMFTMVGLDYESLFSNCDKAMEITNNYKEICRKKVVLLVHAHKEALRLVELLENTFSIPFAIQMLLAIIGMSVTLLQITQQNDIIKSCRYTLYVVGQLIHLFWFSFEGQKLIDHSLQMSDKIYNSSWYEVSASSQKLIILVMMRSTRPSVLSAGKIFIFSLESFTTALQTSMSYFTVLATV
ncbi:hypothetical protein PUN28_005418 [Cardiocondyla obscurior]|uniref:Odorant receptor n=2 Tax=Cardiocondyla obscurior TaxID=286306 RepID=A0AAW2GJ30_9HYME